jgi:hypothetical protein
MEPTVAKTPIVSHSVNVDTTSPLLTGDTLRSNQCGAKHRCPDTFNPSSEYPIGCGLSSHHITDNAWLSQVNQILNSDAQIQHSVSKGLTEAAASVMLQDFHCPNHLNHQHRCSVHQVWIDRKPHLPNTSILCIGDVSGLSSTDNVSRSNQYVTDSSVWEANSQYVLSVPTPFPLNYQPSTLKAGINSLPTAAQNIYLVVISCCWYLLSALLTAACLPASNYFSQTSSSAGQEQLGLSSPTNLYNLYPLNVTNWPSYPLVEPVYAKKAVAILNFLPDGCLLHPTLVLLTMMKAELRQSIFIILIIILSMFGMSEVPDLSISEQSISGAVVKIKYHSLLDPTVIQPMSTLAVISTPLQLSEALPMSEQSISGAVVMNSYHSLLNILLFFRPETATPSLASMHLYQMGKAGVEGLQLLPLTHATVHPLRAIEGVLTYYLQLCVLQLLPPAYPSVSVWDLQRIYHRNEEVTKTLSRDLLCELQFPATVILNIVIARKQYCVPV